MPIGSAGESSDECALQNQGLPCACGRLRRGCPHLVRGRARRLRVTLVEGLTAARALDIAVGIRRQDGVAEVRFL